MNLSNKQKALFIDHSYHILTKSTVFLMELLNKFFNLHVFYGENWRIGNFAYVVIPNSINHVFYCQILPDHQLLKEQIENDHKKITWFAMYDVVITSINESYLKNLAKLNFKTICFSKFLFNLLNKYGFNCKYFQYYIDPQKIKRRIKDYQKRNIHFWYRRNPVNWQLIKKLLGYNIDSIVIKNFPDPGHKDIRIPKKDFLLYKIQLINDYLDQSEYDLLLNKANIVIAPRIIEGIGISFLEALTKGQCVIAPDSTTMNEYIVHNWNGHLYDIDNPKPIDLSNFAVVGKRAGKEALLGFKKWQNAKLEMINYILND